MQNLTEIQNEYKFLSKTNFQKEEEIGEYLNDLYTHSIDLAYEDEKTTIFVPSRHSIFKTAWCSFEDVYLPYIMNGAEPTMANYLQERLEDGFVEWEIADDIADWRMNNASYGLYMTDGKAEKQLLEDIYKGLDRFCFSYYLDNGGLDMLREPENLVMGKWQNPPIQRVW